MHLIQASVVLQGWSHFSDSIEARLLKKMFAALPAPPVRDMTRGEGALLYLTDTLLISSYLHPFKFLVGGGQGLLSVRMGMWVEHPYIEVRVGGHLHKTGLEF